MTTDLKARIEAALERLEELQHRMSTIIEANRQQVPHLVSELKIRELRNELRAILRAMK